MPVVDDKVLDFGHSGLRAKHMSCNAISFVNFSLNEANPKRILKANCKFAQVHVTSICVSDKNALKLDLAVIFANLVSVISHKGNHEIYRGRRSNYSKK